MGDLSATLGDDKRDKIRRVRFNTSVRMVLIPTTAEYRLSGLSDDLWWNNSDYKDFKDAAVAELRQYLLENSKVDAKTALNLLYQPGMKCEQESSDRYPQLSAVAEHSPRMPYSDANAPHSVVLIAREPLPKTPRTQVITAASEPESALLDPLMLLRPVELPTPREVAWV